MNSLDAAVTFTADKGWAIEGGLAEQIVRQRDEAREQRDKYRIAAARKGDAVDALEALCAEAEELGLDKAADRLRRAFHELRDAVRKASERQAALAEVRAAEEALRLAREKVVQLGGKASAVPSEKRVRNISPEAREKMRENGRRRAAANREARLARNNGTAA